MEQCSVQVFLERCHRPLSRNLWSVSRWDKLQLIENSFHKKYEYLQTVLNTLINVYVKRILVFYLFVGYFFILFFPVIFFIKLWLTNKVPNQYIEIYLCHKFSLNILKRQLLCNLNPICHLDCMKSQLATISVYLYFRKHIQWNWRKCML